MTRTAPAAPAVPAWSPRRWMMMLTPAAAAAAAVALWVAVDWSTERSVLQPTAPAPQAAERSTAAAAPAASPTLENDLPASAPAAGASRDAETSKRLADARSELESQVGADKKDSIASGQYRLDDRANERKGAEGALAKAENAAAKPDGTFAPARPAEEPRVGAVAETVQVAEPNRSTGAPLPPPPATELRQVVQAPPAPQQMTQQSSPQSQAQQQGGFRQQAAEPSSQQAKEQSASAAERPAASAAGRGGGAASNVVAADELLRARKASVIVDAIAPGASVRWRVVDGRLLQGSRDSGVTWTDQYTVNVGVQLTSGVAVSSTVCWFVGRAGLVVRTTDGRAWAPVPFPEPVDLMSVTAANARSATVTAADGRVFGTADGGATWTRR